VSERNSKVLASKVLSYIRISRLKDSNVDRALSVCK